MKTPPPVYGRNILRPSPDDRGDDQTGAHGGQNAGEDAEHGVFQAGPAQDGSAIAVDDKVWAAAANTISRASYGKNLILGMKINTAAVTASTATDPMIRGACRPN